MNIASIDGLNATCAECSTPITTNNFDPEELSKVESDEITPNEMKCHPCKIAEQE